MDNDLTPLLAPLARLLVSQGVSFPAFSETMKGHYLAAAMAEPGGKPTASRLSVLTGLQRRDIARLTAAEAKPERPNPLVRLVAEWQTNPAYGARPLPKNGDAPSFDALAYSIRKDIHPRTLLDRLVAAGTVEVRGAEVHLLQTSYQPQAGSEEQLDYLADNVGDHLAAAVDNVRNDAPHFERAAHYTELTDDQIELLERQFREGQMELLRQVSQQAAVMKRAGEGGKGRFRAGGYFYKVAGEGDE